MLIRVLGFDLSAMAKDVYDDAVVDVVGPQTVVSEPVVIKVCLRSRLPVASSHHLPTGPLPWQHYCQAARLLVSIQACLDLRPPHQSALLRPLFRYLLHVYRGAHPS